MTQTDNPNYHKLLIQSNTQADREQNRLDNLMGEAVVDRILQLEGKLPCGVAEIAGQQDLTAEQRERLPYVMAMYADCYLCSKPPPPAGMYTWEVGGEKVVTPICLDCSRIIGVKEMIKKALMVTQ